jgi:hypothetical protein
MKASGTSAPIQNHVQGLFDYTFDGQIHLPQLFSQESAAFISPHVSLNTMDIECSQNLLRLTTSAAGGCGPVMQQQERFHGGDWSFLDKLLASHHHSLDQSKCNPSSQVLTDHHHHHHHHVGTSSTQKFPFHYLGCETDILKFSK